MRNRRTPSFWFCMVLAATCLSSSIAEGVIVRHDRSLERTLELGSRLPFVGSAGGGSGTLIESRWVLTAAHVVEHFGPFDFRVRFADREYAVVRTFIHPGDEEMPWDRRTHDIALLLLEKPVESITPAPLYRAVGELGEMQELGKTAVVAGTGFFGTAGEGHLERDGRLRAVTNRISDVEDQWLKTVFSRPPGGTDLEGLDAAGDSGGPLLVEVEGTSFVVGVSSYAEYIDAEAGEETYGAMDFFTRVSSHVNWIDGVMAAAEKGESVPSEGPAPSAEIRDAAEGLPGSVVGERATAYFEAFNSHDDTVFAEFTRRHRTAASLSGSSMEERLNGYRESVEEWGQLRLVSYAVTSPRELYVLVHSRIGEMVFGFEAAPEPPHRLVSITLSY